MTKISASRLKKTFDQAMSPFLPGKAAPAGAVAVATRGADTNRINMARINRCMVRCSLFTKRNSRAYFGGQQPWDRGDHADGVDGRGGVRRDGGAGLGGRRGVR